MPVPSNRTPVRLARGDYSALSTNLSSLGEGELVFAKDEDRLYMVEGGVLVPCTTDISDKADLINGKLDPAQLPSLAISEYMGEAADEAAMIAFVGERGDWCVRTDLGATFILSTDDPTIATNWVQISSPEPVIPVDSVNGETGAVSLGIQDMDDFGLIEPTQDYTVIYNENPDADGEARLVESGGGTPGVLGAVVLYVSDSNGESIASKVLALPATGSIKISSDNSTFYDYPYIAISAQRADGFDALPDYSNAVRLTFGGTERPLADTLGLAVTYTGPLYIQLAALALQDGDILEWNATDGKFKPTQLATVAASGAYSDLSGTPTLATVATTGAYSDLSGTPTLATVATTGSYNDLADQPSIVDTDRIQDQTDFELYQEPAPVPFYDQKGNSTANGGFLLNIHASNYFMIISEIDADGNDLSAYYDSIVAAGGGTLYYSEDGVNWSTDGGVTPVDLFNGTRRLNGIDSTTVNSTIYGYTSNSVYITFDNPVGAVVDIALADNDFIRWVDADQKFRPIQLADVATSGDYSDLSGAPTLATVATSGAYGDLSGTPTLATVATSGAYSDLSGAPTLATVATTGAYSDLSGTPTLATVATTGSYNDLSGTPTLATVATSGAYSDLSGAPTLATVATSGSYNDLADQPTIPTAIDDLSDVDTATTAPTDGQVLTWVNANSQWEPGDLQGASIRAALGIGEYADDAAAGTGGVASGAMYYNTTSSDYRLKS